MRQAIQTTKIVLVALASGLMAGCQTTNTTGHTPDPKSNSPTFVHSYTKFSFPDSLGAFQRVEVKKYDQQGRDVGVGFNSSTPVSSTVYVYPGPKDFALLPSPGSTSVSEAILSQHFERCKQDIVRNHPDAKLLHEGPDKIVQGKSEFEGKKAVYSLSYKFGFVSQESVSELHLFMIEPGTKFLATDRHFVKYRFTYPTSKKAQAESEISALMTNLVWPAK